MNSLSLFSPSFADSVIDVLDKNFAGSFGVFSPLKHPGCGMPSVDIRETDSGYIMDVDLPGYTKDEVEISLKDRVMTLSSSKKEEKEEKTVKNGFEYILKERSAKHFIRRFSMPENIDQEAVSADFENGVLTVHIPKKPDTQPRKIEITHK